MNTEQSAEKKPQATANPEALRRVVDGLYATGYWLFGEERYADAGAIFRVMIRIAYQDERGWLGLGACHEAIEQADIALEMYGTGRRVASRPDRLEAAREALLRSVADGSMPMRGRLDGALERPLGVMSTSDLWSES